MFSLITFLGYTCNLVKLVNKSLILFQRMSGESGNSISFKANVISNH